jgi:RHS repeat-associated protein
VNQVAAGTAGVVVDGANYTNSTSSFPTTYPGLQSKTDNGAPKAYLNWLVFDRNFVLLNGGFKQSTTAGKEAGTDVAHERVFNTNPIVIAEPGYVYIYVSNENTTLVDVYFDDFNVTQTKSPVIASNDYYAFGLTFNSYSRENSVPQNYLYNKKELINDLSLGVYDYGARQYDPAIGRWTVIDPLSEKGRRWSPYTYGADNPIRFIDPDGMWFVDANGKKVDVSVNKGQIVLGKNATADLKRMALLVNQSGSKTAIQMFNKLGGNDTKINFKIETKPVDNRLLGVHQAHDKDGKVLTWQEGTGGTGKFQGSPAYIKDKNGNTAYKEASITVFEGNFTQTQIIRQRQAADDP